MSSARFHIISLGCPKNYVDSEYIRAFLKQEGFEETPDIQNADIIVVNTCAFIEPAKQESIDTILEVAQEKKKSARIIVSGCLAERYSSLLPKLLPEVFSFVGAKDVSLIKIATKKSGVYTGREQRFFYKEVSREMSLPGYSYLRISDGCSRKCSFCAIPLIKGKQKSIPPEYLIEEAKKLASQGAKEIIVVGQDITTYGYDLTPKTNLLHLLENLSNLEDVKWIRLLYLYPSNVTDELINFVYDNPKVLPYFDIPFQHASRKILKKMRREGDGGKFLELIEKVREKFGDKVSIRTSLITGFPGETEQDFKELIKFVEKAKFDRLGVFTFSPEEGTPAFSFKDRVNKCVANDRKRKIMELQYEVSREQMKKWIGKKIDVLIEGEINGVKVGRSFLSAPEIDGNTFVETEEDITSIIGEIITVKITGADIYDLYGETV